MADELPVSTESPQAMPRGDASPRFADGPLTFEAIRFPIVKFNYSGGEDGRKSGGQLMASAVDVWEKRDSNKKRVCTLPIEYVMPARYL